MAFPANSRYIVKQRQYRTAVQEEYACRKRHGAPLPAKQPDENQKSDKAENDSAGADVDGVGFAEKPNKPATQNRNN